MRAIVPVPDHRYYLWQMLVHWNYMRDIDFPVHYLFYTGEFSNSLEKIMEGSGASITVWDDWRQDKSYNPEMKTGLLGRYLEAHPDMVDETLLLLDPDALPLATFLNNVDEIENEVTAENWVGTDVSGYAGYDHLREHGVITATAKTFDLTAQAARKLGQIGAQIAFTGRDGLWWLNLATESRDLYGTLDTERNEGKHAVQSWCAEMYATWLKMGQEGIAATPSDHMSMVWASGNREEWETAGFFHNAGVTDGNGRDFCKIDYQYSPFREDLSWVSKDSATYPYVQLILKTADDFPGLIW